MKFVVYSDDIARFNIFKTFFENITLNLDIEKVDISYINSLVSLESFLSSYEYEICGAILDFKNTEIERFNKFYKNVDFVFEHFKSLVLFDNSIIKNVPWNSNFDYYKSFERILSYSTTFIQNCSLIRPYTYSLEIENGHSYLIGTSYSPIFIEYKDSFKITLFKNYHLSIIIDRKYSRKRVANICLNIFSNYSNISNIFGYINKVSFKYRDKCYTVNISDSMTSVDIINMLKEKE